MQTYVLKNNGRPAGSVPKRNREVKKPAGYGFGKFWDLFIIQGVIRRLPAGF